MSPGGNECGQSSPPKSPDDWGEVHRSFAQLAALLDAHEEAEGEIVRCSLLDDLGTVD
jgi:hypothetical protein